MIAKVVAAARGEEAAVAPTEDEDARGDAAGVDEADVRAADGDVTAAGAQAGIKRQRAATAAVVAASPGRMMSPTSP